MGKALFNRRAVNVGIASLIWVRPSLADSASSSVAGCCAVQSGCSFGDRGTDTFPGIDKISDNAAMAIGVIGLELNRLLQITANPAFYDDSDGGAAGNAGALDRAIFPGMTGIPTAEGTVVLGNECYKNLGGTSAAIAAVFAHEMGHILQRKYVRHQLSELRTQDRSVFRTELHADFVCGYYAAYRKRSQSDWPVVIQEMTQFKFGDYQYANPLHHGTHLERKTAVGAGFRYGDALSKFPADPADVASAGVRYVSSLHLDTTSHPQSC